MIEAPSRSGIRRTGIGRRIQVIQYFAPRERAISRHGVAPATVSWFGSGPCHGGSTAVHVVYAGESGEHQALAEATKQQIGCVAKIGDKQRLGRRNIVDELRE